mmetsp:Transcript_13683/g.34444  ORF Transcript_13683/g.34444 Transcript_13683/m.34444 type:complete len:390 (-) Transcript_13683:41-1210(-)
MDAKMMSRNVSRSGFGAVHSNGVSQRRALAKRASGRRGVLARGSTGAQKAEYIWFDGLEGQKEVMFNEMRSKTKVIQDPVSVGGKFPLWSYDGSSTGQAEGGDSDCILRPVWSCPDPIRGDPHVLVMCEVLTPEGKPHPTNTRHLLEQVIDNEIKREEPLYGFEQEYTMLGKDGRVFGWPEAGFPAPQGPFYCGVGSEAVYGRPLAEAHLDACIRAGIQVSGINAEVMPGQWEYQVGPVGPLELGDQVMVSRWLLHRIGEDMGITTTFAPKPVKGDWNGTGAHTNFSTKSMRAKGGLKAIDEAIDRLSKRHSEHITSYGLGNEERLTGLHETFDIDTFRAGVADRGASVRIPRQVAIDGQGYLEDRRPSANVDPYTVSFKLLETIFAKH